MGFLDFFGSNKKEDVQFDVESFSQKLSNSGYDNEQIDDIIEELQDTMESVREKSVIPYDEFFGVSSNLDNIYNIPKQRLKACESITQLIEQNPEASNAVKLYASYLAYGSASVNVDEFKTVVSSTEVGQEDEKNPEIEKFLQNWERHTKMKRHIFSLAIDVFSFGDAFLEKVKNPQGKIIQLNYIPSKTVVMKLNVQGDVVNYFQVLDPNIDQNFNNSYTEFKISSLEAEKKIIKFKPDEILHFSDGSLPGVNGGPLSNLIILWKFLKILEESLVIYNITRARRFVVYFLDVTGKTREKIKSSVRGFTTRLKAIFKMDVKSGSIYSGKSTIPVSSDLVIPVTKDSKTDVKTIAADSSSKGFGDLKIYTNRLVDNLLIGHIFSDGPDTEKRKQIEKAFFRMVRIYQKQFSYTLEDLYMEVLKSAKFNNVNVEILFPSVDNNEEVEVVDMIVRRMMVVNQLMAVLGIVPPTSWIIKYVFKDLSQLEMRELIRMLKQEQEQETEEYPDVFTEESSKRGDRVVMLSLLHKLNVDSNSDIENNQSQIAIFESRNKAIIESIEKATNYLQMVK